MTTEMHDMRTSTGSNMWKGINSIGALAGLATALGVGIPALVKANDAQDDNCGNCSENTKVNRKELNDTLTIAVLKSENNTDKKLLEVYNALNTQDKVITAKLTEANERTNKALADLDKATALNKQASDYQYVLLNKEIECTNVKVSSLTNIVDSITKRIIPIDNICPQPMAGCVPVSFTGQVIPTNPTDITNTPVFSSAKTTEQA